MHREATMRRGGEDLTDALAFGDWFPALPARKQEEVAERLVISNFAKGDVVFHQGDRSRGLHCVVLGSLHIFGLSVGGDEALLAIVRPGEWTGFLAALEEGEYAFEARVVEPTAVASLPLTAMKEVFECDVETYKSLLKPLLTSTRNLYAGMTELQKPTAFQRIADRLLTLSRWPYAQAEGRVAHLDHVSQELVASSVGLTRQTANRMLGHLAAEGIISVRYGRIEIRAPEALKAIAIGAPGQGWIERMSARRHSPRAG